LPYKFCDSHQIFSASNFSFLIGNVLMPAFFGAKSVYFAALKPDRQMHFTMQIPPFYIKCFHKKLDRLDVEPLFMTPL
tara:strand:+ start:876 stop:1109 length:234 start_codon:yes stop_codon:yes gene_type:complete